MTIRKKIWISNILMVLIPIFITVVSAAVCLHTSLGYYWNALEHMYKDENGVQSAQSLIYTYQQELWEVNWKEYCDRYTLEPVVQNETMNKLEKKLADMGYHISIVKNGNELYTSIPVGDVAAAEAVAGDAIYEAKTLTFSNNNISIVKNTFVHEDKTFSILAINSSPKSEFKASYLQNYILRYIGIILAVFFLVMIGTNVLLSWWISRSVLRPLRILGEGMRKIRDGELDTELPYDRKDEFGEVCRDFEEMESYLKESVEQRITDEKRKRELINGISHDLRTPLTSIGGYLDGLMDGIADTPEKRARYFNAIKIRTKDLERLVDSLSQYSRLDSRAKKYEFKNEDLTSFIEKYLADCSEETKINNIDVIFKAEKAPYMTAMDDTEMKRVLDNLFTNTVRYREKGSSRVKIELTHEDDGYIKIIFADDGPGVPDESLDRLFEAFYRADGARSHTEKGSGIGLAVVKEIITGHGGDIKAENDHGLEIIIRLPEGKEGTST